MDDEMKREFAAVRADIAKVTSDVAKVTSAVAKLAAATRADIAKLTTLSQHMFSKIGHLEDKTDRITKDMVTRGEFNSRFDTLRRA